MAAWWAENMKHRVPDHLLRLVAAAPAAPAASSSTVFVPAAVPTPPLSQLEQAGELLDATFAELRRAQQCEPYDPGRVALAQRAYKDASEHLRRVELTAPKINLAAGSVVEREAVREILTNLHTLDRRAGFHQKIQHFWNNHLGLPFEQKKVTLTENDLLACRDSRYRFGDLP